MKSKMWDNRIKKNVFSLNCNTPVTSVQFNENDIFTAGVDGLIKTWDIRKKEIKYTLDCKEIITCISLSSDNNYLLSNSMNAILTLWNVKPFVKDDNRLKNEYKGSNDDLNMVTCGNSNLDVIIWDKSTSEIIYKLPGHKGTVNSCIFHPEERIIASCSSDSTIYLGELEK